MDDGLVAEKLVHNQLRQDYWWNRMWDVQQHCKACPVYATHKVISMLASRLLLQCCEAFAIADQTAETVAKLFVEEATCQYGVPE